MDRAKFKNRCERLKCEVVLFGATERLPIELGQLSLGNGRCVPPAPVTCPCSGESPIHCSVVPKLGRLSVSVDVVKDTTESLKVTSLLAIDMIWILC